MIQGDMGEFINKYQSFLNEFGKGKKMVLSSSENDKVTSRMMSIVHINGMFYFQTDKTFRKYHQLISNPQVALCIDNIQIEGISKEVGHPLSDTSFCGIYKECFTSSFNRYSALENEVLFAVEPTYIERWIYVDGIPFLETFDVEKEEYRRVRYLE